MRVLITCVEKFVSPKTNKEYSKVYYVAKDGKTGSTMYETGKFHLSGVPVEFSDEESNVLDFDQRGYLIGVDD